MDHATSWPFPALQNTDDATPLGLHLDRDQERHRLVALDGTHLRCLDCRETIPTQQPPAPSVQTSGSSAEHPSWCLPWVCTLDAQRAGLGMHLLPMAVIRSRYGSDLEVGVAREHVTPDSQTWVRLCTDSSEQPGTPLEEWLEPEEARQLGRLLVDASERAERIRRGDDPEAAA